MSITFVQPLPVSNPAVFDFTKNGNAIVASRIGADAYVAIDAQTVKLIAAGATPLYENRGGVEGGGVWSFPTITNLITAPFDFTNAAWLTQNGPVQTANNVVAPDGTTTGTRVADHNAAAETPVFQQPNNAAHTSASVWARVPIDDQPSLTPAGAVYRSQGAFTNPGAPANGVSIASSGPPSGSLAQPGGAPDPQTANLWKRLQFFVDNGIGNFAVYPAGATGNADFDNTAQGAVQLWGAQAVGTGDIPLINGVSQDAIVKLKNTDLGKCLVNGDFDCEGSFIVQYRTPVTFGAPNTPVYIFSSQGPDGLISLRYNLANVSTWVLTVRGVDVLTTPIMSVGGTLSEFTWRVWYKPSTGKMGIRLACNGAVQYSVETTGVAAGAPLATRTSFYLGSNVGASSLSAQWTQLEFLYYQDPNNLAPEMLVLGDSILAYSQAVVGLSTKPLSSSYIFDSANKQWRNGRRILSYAHPADTIAVQRAVYAASPYATAASVKAVLLQVGFNDVNNGIDSAATIIANYQSLVNLLRANLPTAKIVIGRITPGVAGGTAATRVTVNTAIDGGGGTPITGVDARVSFNSTNLESAPNVMNTAYTVGDGIHPNELGARIANMPPFAAALTSLGLLP